MTPEYTKQNQGIDDSERNSDKWMPAGVMDINLRDLDSIRNSPHRKIMSNRELEIYELLTGVFTNAYKIQVTTFNYDDPDKFIREFNEESRKRGIIIGYLPTNNPEDRGLECRFQYVHIADIPQSTPNEQRPYSLEEFYNLIYSAPLPDRPVLYQR